MQEFKQYLISLIVLTGLVSGYVFHRYADRYPFPIGAQFDPGIRSKYRQMLNQEEPQILVLGDSVARTNVDKICPGDRDPAKRSRSSARMEPALLYYTCSILAD